MPTFFQKQGKQILILYTFPLIGRHAQFQGLTVIWALTKSKKTIQIFPVTAFLTFKNIPLHRSSRLEYSKSVGWNGVSAVKMSVHIFLHRQIIDCSQGCFSFCLYYIHKKNCVKQAPCRSCCLSVCFGNWGWKIPKLAWKSFKTPYSYFIIRKHLHSITYIHFLIT